MNQLNEFLFFKSPIYSFNYKKKKLKKISPTTPKQLKILRKP